ncbi:MAG: 30S ribosomal protein S17 [Planctomycetota bacterium]|nr:30S ribosomal protein S17 [Planctomycetota bacterium]MDP6990105.1 30S ribosomal protein S17 [Planctomycetota bacterium]
MNERNKRRTLRGLVVSDKMDATITVRVERMVQHPRYLKYIRRHKKYTAHDASGEARMGDFVEIVETRPISKNKRWRLTSVIRKASLVEEAEA